MSRPRRGFLSGPAGVGWRNGRGRFRDGALAGCDGSGKSTARGALGFRRSEPVDAGDGDEPDLSGASEVML